MFRPQDYWRGSVDYMPWKLGDAESRSSDGCQPPSTRMGDGTALPKGGEKIRVQSGGKNPRTVESRHHQVGGADRSATAKKNRSPVSAVAPANKKVDDTGRRSHHVDGAGVFSGQVGVNGAYSCANRDVRDIHRGGDSGCVSGRNNSSTLEAGGGEEVGTALHGVLDALRKVREERLRLASRFSSGAPKINSK